MAEENKIQIAITGNSEQAQAAISKLSEKLNGLMTQADKTGEKTRGLGGVMKNLQTNWLEASVAIGGGVMALNSFIKAAAGNQEADMKLVQALKNVGEASDDAANALRKQAQDIGQLTTVTGNEISSLMAFGIELGVSTDRIDEATRGAIGLSKSLGMDMNTAMKATASALQGNYSLLERYSVQLRDATTDADKAQIVQGMLNRGWNQATAETKTLGGSIKQMQNSMDDARAAIGEALAPVVVVAARAIKNLASLFVSLPAPIKTTIGGLVGAAIAFKALSTAMMLLNFNPVILGLTAVVGLVTAFAFLLKRTNDYLEENVKLNENTAKAMKLQYDENEKKLAQWDKVIAKLKAEGRETAQAEQMYATLKRSQMELSESIGIQTKHLDGLKTKQQEKTDANKGEGESLDILKGKYSSYADTLMVLKDSLTEYYTMGEAIGQESLEMTMERLDNEIAIERQAYLTRSALITQNYKKGLIDKKEYQKQLESLEKDHAKNSEKLNSDSEKSKYAMREYYWSAVVNQMMSSLENEKITLKSAMADMMLILAKALAEQCVIKSIAAFASLNFFEGAALLAAAAGIRLIGSQVSGAIRAMASGGVIDEPVLGVGQRSGQRYLLGEAGPEQVRPLNGEGGGGFNIYGNITVQANRPEEFIQALMEYARRTGSLQLRR